MKDGGIRLARDVEALVTTAHLENHLVEGKLRGGKNVESPTYIESETKRETVVKINGISIENKFYTKICPNGIMNIM
jgi:hypothetical protein